LAPLLLLQPAAELTSHGFLQPARMFVAAGVESPRANFWSRGRPFNKGTNHLIMSVVAWRMGSSPRLGFTGELALGSDPDMGDGGLEDHPSPSGPVGQGGAFV
jgi:hypothetical protein